MRVPGNCAADARQDLAKVEAESGGAEAGLRIAEFEQAHFPARLEHPEDFLQSAFIIGEIAESEGRGR